MACILLRLLSPICFLVLVSNNRVCVCLLCTMFSVLLFTEERLLTVCSSAVLRTTVSNAFFFERALGYITALRAARATLASVLGPWGGGAFLYTV
jgi:hypothetical protein